MKPLDNRQFTIKDKVEEVSIRFKNIFIVTSDTYLSLFDIEKIAKKIFGIRTVLTNNVQNYSNTKKTE